MAATQLKLTYTTTDGRPFTDAKEAARHQRRLDAIGELAEMFSTKFELDRTVGLNVAASLAEVPEVVFTAMGRTYRRGKDDAAADAPADSTASDNNATD